MRKVKEVLKEEGRSLIWLSKKAGVKYANLFNWINGKHVPRDVGAVKRVAEVLGLDWQELIVEFFNSKEVNG